MQFSGNSQPPLDWVNTSSVGGAYQDYIEDVFVDAGGNTYVCGSFSGALSIGTNNLFTNGSSQAFVAKYDAAGVVQWAVESTGNNQAFANSIYVDAGGSVYVSGHHKHSVLFFGAQAIAANSNDNFYLLKLDANGNSLHLTGALNTSSGTSAAMAVTGDGDDVYITGAHKGSIDFLGGASLGAAIGLEDIFIAKIDSAFTSFSWVTSHGGTNKDCGNAIEVSGVNIVVSGFYGSGSSTFFTSGADYILPNYSSEAIWLAECAKSDGDVNWATSAGTSNGDSRSNDITVGGGDIFMTGYCSDNCGFVETPLTTGPFTYNDFVSSNGLSDIFVAKYSAAGIITDLWSEGGMGEDRGNGITIDASCGEVEICGSFEDTINFGGSQELIANGMDMFVASYDYVGGFNWSFQESSNANETANAISANGGRSSVGGGFLGDIIFGTTPLSNVPWVGSEDHFVSSFQCSNIPACLPTISCPPNDTVLSDAACTTILSDYTGLASVVDGCSSGYSITQNPPPATIMSAGTHPITLTVTDVALNTDICTFYLVVEADVNPIIAECGDVYTNATTGGYGNNSGTFSCAGSPTPGEDIFYQITVPDGNHLLQISMDNAIDANDNYANVYWMGTNCPISSSCIESDSFNVATDLFSNGTNMLTFTADGPNTYYFVVDAQVDSIESFDIEFICNASGIEFDESGCNVLDLDNDGLVPYVNGSSVALDVEPCETVTFCHDLYMANPYDWEWMDSVEMKLGPCYENINLTSFTPDNPPVDNGFFDANGEWDANYVASTNSIVWTFDNSSSEPLGDGNSGHYGCNLYTFCFEAEIAPNCISNDSLVINIIVADDSSPETNGNTSPGFDFVKSNSFNVIVPDPTFDYGSTTLCQGMPDPTPTIGTAGGTFTATAGIIFTDGSPSPTGQIDLSASTIGGPYTITYSVGLCPTTQDVNISISTLENPAFTYPSSTFCQAETDPIPTVTGLTGGSFSAPPGIVFISTSTGEVDLSASTVGGPYPITYTTPGPTCIDSTVFNITINLEDDPSFNYSAAAYCVNDTDPLATITGTTGGSFSEFSSTLIVNPADGEIDVDASPLGTYWVVYTTIGTCPNKDSVEVTINPEDDPTFAYGAISYCAGDPDPTPSSITSPGGNFTAPSQIVFVNSTTGEIDLDASTAGGPYTITYTTPGPNCPNSSTFDITINPEDDASFDYSSNVFCIVGTDPVANITGTSGGLFSSSVEIVFTNTSTGEIDVSASTPGGPYTITYTTPGPTCPNTGTFNVSIINEEDPSFNYSSSSYCQNEANPTPVVSGTPGGTFTGPVQITFIDPLTGQIDFNNSSTGTYSITYTTPGPNCQTSSTEIITINQAGDASFEYSATQYCDNEGAQMPIYLGTAGGVFSSTDSELQLNPSTGEIDLLASTPGGPYEIKFVTSGSCADSATYQIEIFGLPIANAGPDQFLDFKFESELEAVTPLHGIGEWTLLSGTGDLIDMSDPISEITNLEIGEATFNWKVVNGTCPDSTDEVVVTVSALSIPQAITPNGDGNNDVLVISGILDLQNNLQIFNRWGQKIYEENNYQNTWAGEDKNGNILENDTYYYILTINDEFKFNGYIVLKK
jgi:gliding motility-associated-like protein